MTHVAAQARVPKKGLLIFLAVAGTLLLLGTLSVLRGVLAEQARVDIVSVVDGRTVVVNAGGEQKTLRLAGLTTAPRNPDGVTVGPDFCMGEESYVWLRDRLPQGAVASVKTGDGGADGEETAVFKLGGDVVNVAMAEEGMAAPTGVGVDAGLREEITAANAVARGKEVGLYDLEEKCTLPHRLYEAGFALDQIPTQVEATVDAIDARSVEYADVLDRLRLVREDIASLDPERGSFTDLAYAPAKETMQAEADAKVEKGLKVLRDLNAQRNRIAAG